MRVKHDRGSSASVKLLALQLLLKRRLPAGSRSHFWREGMKGVKSRIIKKLKSIPQVDVGLHLKQQLTAIDGIFSDPPPPDSRRVLGDVLSAPKEHRKSGILAAAAFQVVRDGDSDVDSGDNKENARPATSLFIGARSKVNENHTKGCVLPILELETTFRRPTLNSSSLFDPDLLAAFEQAVADYSRVLSAARDASRAAAVEQEQSEQLPSTSTESEGERRDDDPLSAYVEMCPPGGREAVVLYTTSLRGIRKTFEDCSRVKFLFGSLRVAFYERDMSMHMEFREELWRVLGAVRVIPPQLFIKGRYIGGAYEVLALHEQGRLLPLVQGLPLYDPSGPACSVCCSFLFLPCPDCNGSRKLRSSDGGDIAATTLRCPRCNENGLIPCPLCSVSPETTT